MRPEAKKQIQARQRQIEDGLKAAVRQEIARLERLGIPYYVADNGAVVRVEPSGPKE